jgi:hypothetical protein
VSADLAQRLAAGLREHVVSRRAAEERLSSFAFTEAGNSRGEPAAPSIDWRHYLSTALRAAGEPATIRLLDVLRDGERTLPALAGLAPTAAQRAGEPDRAAAADWVGSLAAAGLVARELAGDRVSLTRLGAALLDLVQLVEEGAGEGLT